MKNIFFVLGGPGSGKGTICKLIKNQLGFTHLSVGEIIRDYMDKNPTSEKTLQYKSTLTDGNCIPASESIHFLLESTNQMYKDEDNINVLIDGYPRSLEQLDVYNSVSECPFNNDSSNNVYLLYINTPNDVMIARMRGRGRDFRDRDREIMMKRIGYYHNETMPVIEKIKELCPNKVLELNGLNHPTESLNSFKQFIS